MTKKSILDGKKITFPNRIFSQFMFWHNKRNQVRPIGKLLLQCVQVVITDLGWQIASALSRSSSQFDALPISYFSLEKKDFSAFSKVFWYTYHPVDHLICNHFSTKVQKSGSRKVVLQIRIFFSGQPLFSNQKKNLSLQNPFSPT